MGHGGLRRCRQQVQHLRSWHRVQQYDWRLIRVLRPVLMAVLAVMVMMVVMLRRSLCGQRLLLIREQLLHAGNDCAAPVPIVERRCALQQQSC